ncbi:major facilitator superfamily domain-containing protein [Melanogaster broomeanus]|nr:major facilitator superfamily domain-containing protein [Melanogaster broomeanus]
MSVPASPTCTLANLPTPQIPRASDPDLECQPPRDSLEKSLPDTEDVVTDDPRQWSRARKTISLLIVFLATIISGLATNIQNPANPLIEEDLHATNVQVSWTIATWVFVQGNFPLVWSAASEIKGRKFVYVAAFIIFLPACNVLAKAQTINVLIGMRALQAIGSSAPVAISAATLSDMYESPKWWTMTGALLGVALGPFLGGSLSIAFRWRASFYFLLSCGGINLVAFLFLFKDTFRRERSLTYQAALRRRIKNLKRPGSSSDSIAAERGPSPTGSQDITHDAHVSGPQPALNDIHLSFADVNPFPVLWKIVKRRNNVAILLVNGFMYAFPFGLWYTCTRTLALEYDYDAANIGRVLLSLGAGCIAGSVIGGRWSDHVVTKMKEQNGGKWYAEMRLRGTTLAMPWLPPCVIGYAWVAEKHVHIAALCVMLFLFGFFSFWIYANTLAYLVEANTGRSSFAVTAHHSFRGTLSFVIIMVAVPLQDTLGDGRLYTAFAVLLLALELLIVLVIYKGASWREEGEGKE